MCFSFPTVAIHALPVFRGAGFRPGVSAERLGVPPHDAALSQHGAPPEPHVPHRQRLLAGEMEINTQMLLCHNMYRCVLTRASVVL